MQRQNLQARGRVSQKALAFLDDIGAQTEVLKMGQRTNNVVQELTGKSPVSFKEFIEKNAAVWEK